MSSPAPAINKAHWPTQTEAAVQLGTNERTIRRWIEAGRLHSAIRHIAGRKPATIIDPEDIERVRDERQPPEVLHTDSDVRTSLINDVSSIPGNAALARTEPAAMALAAMFSNALKALLPPPAPAAPKLFLDLDAAAEYSGLPKRFLSRLVRDGKLPAMQHAGVVYIKRADLDNLDAMPHASEPVSRLAKKRP